MYVTSPKSLLFCCFVTFAQKPPGLKVGYKSTLKCPQVLLLLHSEASWNQLPWQTKSILIIVYFLPQMPQSAVFCASLRCFLFSFKCTPCAENSGSKASGGSMRQAYVVRTGPLYYRKTRHGIGRQDVSAGIPAYLFFGGFFDFISGPSVVFTT